MPGQPDDSARHDAVRSAVRAAAGESARVYRAEGLRRAGERGPRSRPQRPLRDLLVSRGAAAALVEVDRRVRRQLRLVDHHPDRPDQHRDVPAQAQERRLDAEDAGAAAAGESHPGSLLEDEDDRSWPVEDERRADGALQREGREPGQRLRADAADDAGAVCVLLDVVGGRRDSWRAVGAVDQGSLAARSVLRHAPADGRDDVLAAEHDAGGGSRAAESDDADADHVPGVLPVGAKRPGALLADEQPDRHRPAVRDEPVDRQARGEGAAAAQPSAR